MKLNFKFCFVDNTIVGNVLEWDRKLKAAIAYKGLYHFSACSVVLDTLIKEGAFRGMKDGFYHLSLAKDHRLGMELRSLGNGSYVMCVFEPRIGQGIDYSFKYHFAYVGDDSTFEAKICWADKPYTVIFNELTDRALFDPGVSIAFLREEMSGNTPMMRYLDRLMLGDVFPKPDPVATPIKEVTEMKDDKEVVKEDNVTLTDNTTSSSLPKVDTSFSVKASVLPSFIELDQSISNAYAVNSEVLIKVRDLLAQRTIEYDDQWLASIKESIATIPNTKSTASNHLESYSFSIRDDEDHRPNCTLQLVFKSELTQEEKVAFVSRLFNKFFRKYRDVLYVSPHQTSTYVFALTGKDDEPYRIVLPLLKLRIWLDYYMKGKYAKLISQCKPGSKSTLRTVKEESESLNPQPALSKSNRPSLITQRDELEDPRYGSQFGYSTEIKDYVGQTPHHQVQLGNLELPLSTTQPAKPKEEEVKPDSSFTQNDDEVITVLEELINTFVSNFGFRPDIYILTKILHHKSPSENGYYLSTKELTYAQAYRLAKLFGLEDKPMEDFDTYLDDLTNSLNQVSE